MIRYLLSRLGCLMMVFGMITLAIAIAAIQSGQPDLAILLMGIAATVLGYLLWNRLREKAPRSTRFSLFRKREDVERRKKKDNWEDRFHDQTDFFE
jgi:uncharacterized membrane protein YqgA involved in biofilm formation